MRQRERHAARVTAKLAGLPGRRPAGRISNWRRRALLTGLAVVTVAATGIAGPALTASAQGTTPTFTTVEVSPNPAIVNQPVKLIATIKAADGSVPAGTVSFSDNDIAIPQCTNVPVQGGTAICPYQFTSIGTHRVVASFSDFTDFEPSKSDPLPVPVNPSGGKTPTTTTFTITPSPATVNQQATLTALVTAAGKPVTSGTVSFVEAGGTLCTAPLRSDGTAACPYSFTSIGTHEVAASYSGSVDFEPSGTVMPLTVIPSGGTTPTTTAVEAVPNPATVNEPVTLIATVKAADGSVPVGTVSFYDNDIAIPQCTDVKVDQDGTAICRHQFTSTGTHRVVASFSDFTDFEPSKSPPLEVTVNPPGGTIPTTTTLTITPNPATVNEPVTLRATVSVTASGTPVTSGTVTFYDGDIRVCTANVSADSTATCAYRFTSPGPHAVTAAYSGSGDLEASDDEATVTVNPAGGTIPTTTTLAASPNPATVDTRITLTATVTPAPPGGTVSFSEDSIPVAGCTQQTLTSGMATCAVTYPTAGAHTILATYSGTTGFDGSTSPAVSITVTAPTPIPPGGGAAPHVTTDSTLPSGTVGRPYREVLSAEGGQPPYTWVKTTGQLPPGLRLLRDGILAGIPTKAGTFTFATRVTDASGATARQAFKLAIGTHFGVALSLTAPHAFRHGGTGTLGIRVRNTSHRPTAGPVRVSVTLPRGLVLISAGRGRSWSCRRHGRTSLCERRAAIRAGAVTVITVPVAVQASAGQQLAVRAELLSPGRGPVSPAARALIRVR